MNEGMHVVIIKQEQGKYAFLAPLKTKLNVGDMVLVRTRFGESEGTCVTPSFWVEDPKAFCQLWGTQQESMKPVIGLYRVERFDEEE